ncbi:DEAD/DEAH box helicase [Haloimpatiens sp. FM7315]|uniref:DEAD/DEAH box helicase n=1 Tax=Haloimpatiens sp. FM7315 TaxID=3298609 RepID=UPI0035A3431C
MSHSFDTLNLDTKLIDALKKEGIINPTDIQTKAIPLALENKDIIGESQTGSGKTLAYLLPIFQKINTEKKEMQAIILAPTHELVMQINKEIQLLSKNSLLEVTSTPIMGEINIKRQIEKLKDKPHIIVGSAGRIHELIKMKKIKAHTVKTIVIDEGDKLLDNNNLNSVKDVIKTTMKDRQLMVFSATINQKTLDVAKSIMKEPAIIKIKEENISNPNITHMYLVSEKREKIEVLRKLVASIKPKRAIVFINKSEEIELTTLKLQYHHLNAYGLYGSASKEERKKALEDFRTGKINLLVASDLAARGLDVKDVTHIFNLDLSKDPKEYLHRTGRTGRAGKTGTAISILTINETSLIKKYSRSFNFKLEEKEIFKGNIVDPRKNKNSNVNQTKKTFKSKTKKTYKKSK